MLSKNVKLGMLSKLGCLQFKIQYTNTYIWNLDPERCYGEGGGRGVHVWEHMYTRGGFMSMYGKANTVL